MTPLLLLLPFFNDGSGHMAAGGSVGLIKGQHPSIRMVDEKLHIVLPAGKVRVEYVFKNDGKATTALMAFPEEGYMLPPADKKRIQKGESLFGYFHSWVDGKPIPVRRVAGEDNGLMMREGGGYRHWWVKEVPFAKGQTRKVVNEYQGGLGWGPPWTPERSFSYTLRTGGTWKGGKIGHLLVTVDARGLEGKAPQVWSPDEWTHSNAIWTLERNNFKPEEDIAVRWPDGFYNFTVNGKKYPDSLYEISPPPPMKVSPVKEGDEVYLPIPLVKPILGAMLSQKAGQVNLSRGSRHATVSMRPSKTGGMVPFRSAVKGLGGTSQWQNGKLIVTLPK